ncbi:MAG: ribokinase, partial [Leuconostoc gelidum]
VGNDDNGEIFKELLRKENINTDYITQKNKLTGTATILLESNGHNTILVNGGANMALTEKDVKRATKVLQNADVVVAQLEVPKAVIAEAFKIAKTGGAITVLNPAPITHDLGFDIISKTDLIIPNESEAAALVNVAKSTDFKTIEDEIYQNLSFKGLKNIVITLGDKGVYYHISDEIGVLPIFPVNVVDTTAAGDTFIGTIVANLRRDMSSMRDLLLRSTMASALAVSQSGAISSIPYKTNVDEKIKAIENLEVSR